MLGMFKNNLKTFQVLTLFIFVSKMNKQKVQEKVKKKTSTYKQKNLKKIDYN
jgi:hypothetical protein